MPTYTAEARLYARHILKSNPAAKIAVLYSNDEYGRDYLQGLKEGLGAKADTAIVRAESFEWSDPTVDSQVVSLYSSGADTLFTATAGKQAVQAIRKKAQIGWNPAHYTALPASSVRGILTHAGLENAIGSITAYYAKNPSDPRLRDDAAIKEYFDWAKAYFSGDAEDTIVTYGYQVAQALEYVLRKCGDDLTRENVMKVVTSMKDVEFPMLMPGVKANTSSTDYRPLRQFVMMRFDGTQWVQFTDVIAED